MNSEQRAALAWLAATIAYILLLQAPGAGTTLAPIIAGAIIAPLARDATKAFITGALAGATALLETAGAWITLSTAIITSAAGPAITLTIIAYHTLTPALIAAGLTLLTRKP